MKRTLFVLLGLALLTAGYQAVENGFFKGESKNASKAVGHSATNPTGAATTLGVANSEEPTPTPLPPYFPVVTQDDLNAAHKGGEMSLSQAFATCWRDHEEAPESETADLTMDDITAVFGRLKKHEILETHDDETKLGLIFEPVIFKAGAAGTATEVAGKIREFQIRADGRIIHCAATDGSVASNCRCL